jgi:dipeptidyl aminopeptidase/acylaminoacyl peptidase
LNCPGVAVAAVPGALVFQSATGFYVWDTRSGRVTRHLGNQPSYAAPAFGATLPWCSHCNRALELTNVASGKTKQVALSIDGAYDALASAQWSPDGTRLVIPEQVDPGRSAYVILVDVAADRATRLETTGHTASVAWSGDGRRLYIAASNKHETRLAVRDLDAGTSRDLGTIPLPTLHLAAIISTEQAAHLLGAHRVASPSRCVVPIPIRSAQPGCSYRY